MGKTMDLSAFVVRAADGSVDEGATQEKFAGELSAWIHSQEEESGEIALAVSAVFDSSPKGANLPMPALVSLTCQALAVTPETYVSTSEKVHAFIRNCPEYKVAKGKGGGVKRVCDIPPEEPKAPPAA